MSSLQDMNASAPAATMQLMASEWGEKKFRGGAAPPVADDEAAAVVADLAKHDAIAFPIENTDAKGSNQYTNLLLYITLKWGGFQMWCRGDRIGKKRFGGEP